MVNRQTTLTLTPEQAEAVLEIWLQAPVRCTQVRPLLGGMINSVLELTFDQPPFQAVIKLNEPDIEGPSALAGEADRLCYLRAHTRFPCPQVYLEDASGQNFPFAFLLLERLPGDSLGHAPVRSADREALDRQLAEILLDLHRHTRSTFGPLDGPGGTHWAELFVPRMHAVRAEPAIGQRLSPAVLAQVDCAMAKAEDLLADQGTPTLIHGDVWAGNIIVQQKAAGWRITGLVDPGSEYADVEMELAYLESFGKPRPAFMESYTRHCPLRPGYEVRRMIYWLQTYLIHVWLFGDRSYLELTAQTASQLRWML